MIATVTQIGPQLGIAPTCAALGLPRATYYRRRRPKSARAPRRPSPRALSGAERTAALPQLHEPRFVDLAPAEVYATLLDEGAYLCSERTMYRLLAEHTEVRERRDQLRHPTYAAHPERFPGGLPEPPACPTEVWINPPNTPMRSNASSRTRPSDLPRRAPSRSLPSIGALSSRL